MVLSQPIFDDLELLARISHLWTQVDLDYVLREVVKLAALSVGASRASLFFNRNQHLHLSSFVVGMDDFLPEESDEMTQTVLERGLAGWVLQHQQGVVIDDTLNDMRWYHHTEHSATTRSALSVPFAYDAHLYGVITLAHDLPARFTEHHLRLMTIITSQVALAVHNAQSFQAIQTQRRQLEGILHAIPDILLVVDDKQCVIMASDAVEMLLNGREARSMIGQPLLALAEVNPIFQDVLGSLAHVTATKTDLSFEVRSDALNRDFMVNIIAHVQSDSTTPGHIIVLNDVSALRDLTRFKDTVLRAVSHDLRTPMVVISGYADLLQIDLEGQPGPLQYVEGVVHAVTRMEEMLNTLIRAEKLRTNPNDLYERVNLKALVGTVLRDIRPLAARKNIHLEMHLPAHETPTLDGDAMLLQQAMENLVGNAIKYTTDGGRVLVSAYVEGERFHFKVEDNGIGIAADEQPFVFESFYRGNNVDSISGVGLGLSLVKDTIKRHNGDVSVQSEGVGSTFGFWLPLKGAYPTSR
ncbi:MAG: GAF domain-containing sensor histidine kinase [Armatimonadetes bacterium]|nr:GAF domain-containing sensor histidine kinase [Anaerolineae bacterium]